MLAKQSVSARTVLAVLLFSGVAVAQPVSLSPAALPRVGTVDERFQAYNVEMVEVTGGRFWKPYERSAGAADTPREPARQSAAAPSGMDPNLFEYRPPIDLSNARLRRLAAALGPAYVRVSGTWANTVYFHDSETPPPAHPPAGFGAVLTRQQWKGVIDFARAVNGKLVVSFATGAGTRDAAGVWTSTQARRLLDYTKTAGGTVAAAEFMNEPNFAAQGGAPDGYDAAAFARDLEVFRRFYREAAPGSLLLGPGSVGEGGVLTGAFTQGRLRTEDILQAAGPVFDAFSYHIYAAVSQRCAAAMPAIGTTPDAALSKAWLSRNDQIQAFYAGLRDRFEPGKPLWVTETAETACGGNWWASTFLDTFRYLDQHGRLARRGVQVVAHNTLASSDYGLLDEKTYAPRPNYWAAVLWHRLMGPVVLNAGPESDDGLYLYAHCLPGSPGGVTILAINAGRASRELAFPIAGERYTLGASELESTSVALNGRQLEAGANGTLPPLTGLPVSAGRLSIAPAVISFFAFPKAANPSCR